MAKYKDPNSWSYGGIRRRDFRNGGVEADDFEVDFFYNRRLGSKVPRKFCAKDPNNKCAEFYWKERWRTRPDEYGRVKVYGSNYCKRCHRLDWNRYFMVRYEYHHN